MAQAACWCEIRVLSTSKTMRSRDVGMADAGGCADIAVPSRHRPSPVNRTDGSPVLRKNVCACSAASWNIRRSTDRARTRCHRCPGRDAGRNRDRPGGRARHRPHALRRSWRTRRCDHRIWRAGACFRAGANCAVAWLNHRDSGTRRSSCWYGSRFCRGHHRARRPRLAVPVQAAM
jgi:hypothetical protein